MNWLFTLWTGDKSAHAKEYLTVCHLWHVLHEHLKFRCWLRLAYRTKAYEYGTRSVEVAWLLSGLQESCLPCNDEIPKAELNCVIHDECRKMMLQWHSGVLKTWQLERARATFSAEPKYALVRLAGVQAVYCLHCNGQNRCWTRFNTKSREAQTSESTSGVAKNIFWGALYAAGKKLKRQRSCAPTKF